MAIDDKFVTAGISNDVIANMNRGKRKKRKRPKPWDPPSKIEENSENNEVSEKNSKLSEAPLLKDIPDPYIESNKRFKSNSGDPEKESDAVDSPSSSSNAKNKKTVRGQKGDSRETLRGQLVDSVETVRRQSKDSKETKSRQCEDSRETLRGQSVDNAETVERQSKDSKETKGRQYEDSKETVEGQSRDSKDTVRRQKGESKGTESRQYDPISRDSKETPELDIFASILSFEHAEAVYFSLSGNRLKLIDWLAQKCIDTGATCVRQITHQQVAEMSGITNYSTYKKILQRLKSSDLLEVKSYQRGPGSRVDIYLQNSVISVFAKHGKVRGQYGDSKGTYIETDSSSSSSSLNNNIETTTKKKKTELPEDWLEIKIPDSVKEIRFGAGQLKQLFNKGELSAQDVQESLDHLAYDLESGAAEEKNFKSPLHVFMSVLIKGMPYVSEALVKASEEALRAQKELLKRYRQAQKDEAEKNLTEKFESYFKTLSQQKIDELVPPNNIAKSGSLSQKMILRELFTNGEVGRQ